MILELHHAQLAMPIGGEKLARRFYSGILAMKEVEKPTELQSRGGIWFETGATRVHLGVEQPFFAAKKAHPAFRVSSLDNAILVLRSHGVAFIRGSDLPDLTRVYVNDPFGNRIELLEARATP